MSLQQTKQRLEQWYNGDIVDISPEVLDCCYNAITLALKIVYCKDCKHWKSGEDMVGCHTNLGENIGECHCSQWENDYFYYLTKDTDFCSYGEEKQ